MSQPLGSRLSWARDFAIIGAVTGFAAPAPFWWGNFTYLGACAGAGAVVGALLGVVMAGALVGPFARWPFGVLLLFGLGVGAAWGASAAYLGGVAGFGTPAHDKLELAKLSSMAGAVAGAVQLGWFWLPYVLRKSRGLSGVPIVVASCLISGALGFAALAALRLL